MKPTGSPSVDYFRYVIDRVNHLPPGRAIKFAAAEIRNIPLPFEKALNNCEPVTHIMDNVTGSAYDIELTYDHHEDTYTFYRKKEQA